MVDEVHEARSASSDPGRRTVLDLVWGFFCQALDVPTFSWFNRSTAAACWNDPRGARHWAQSIAPRPCMRLDPQGTRTMKHSFASAARLRGDGPILPTASKPWSCSGHRHLGLYGD